MLQAWGVGFLLNQSQAQFFLTGLPAFGYDVDTLLFLQSLTVEEASKAFGYIDIVCSSRW